VKDWDAADKLSEPGFQKGSFTTVSSNGTAQDSAIIWAVQRPDARPPWLTLWAFNGKTGATLAKVDAGDSPHPGGAANAVPVVANGGVYVASYGARHSHPVGNFLCGWPSASGPSAL
jgi:hypothetical protein